MGQVKASPVALIVAGLLGAVLAAAGAYVYVGINANSGAPEGAANAASSAASGAASGGSDQATQTTGLAASSAAQQPTLAASAQALFGVTWSESGVATKPDAHTTGAFAMSFEQAGQKYFAQFFQTQTMLNGSPDDGHATAVELSVVTYAQQGHEWVVVARQGGLTESGAWGQLHNTTPKLLPLNPQATALLLQEHSSGQGYHLSGQAILLFQSNQWRTAGYIQTDESNGGTCQEDFHPQTSDDFEQPCYESTGVISVASGAHSGLPDLWVERAGTQLRADRRGTEPVKSVRVSYQNGQYLYPRDPDNGQ